LGITLLYLGLSFRRLERPSFLDEGSYEAAAAIRPTNALPRDPLKQYRPTLAIDETEIKVQGRWNFFWTAIDTTKEELLSLQLTLRETVAMYTSS